MYPIQDEQNRMYAVGVIARNITERKRAEEEVWRYNEELTALNAIAIMVNSSLDLQQILDQTLDKVLEITKMEVGSLYLTDPQTEELVLSAYKGVSKEFADQVRTFKLGESIVGLAAQSGKPIVADDLTRDPRVTTTLVSGEGIRSLAAIPMKSKNKVEGMINMASYTCHSFTNEEIDFYTAIANQIGVAIENARLYEAVQRELTERKQAEEALRESEENFKALAENANDGIVIGTAEGGWHVYANRRAVEITGYPIEELLKTRIRDLAHPDEFPKLTERYKERLAGLEVPKPYETALLNKDGIKVPIEISPSKTTWQNQPADMVILRDITERKRAEEALRESEERYRIITDRVDDIVWQLDLGLHFVYVSPAVKRVLGYTAQEACGLYVVDLLDEDDLVRMREVIQNRLERKTNFTVPSEYRMRHKDGHWVDVEVLSSPLFDAEGHPTGFVGITRDIGMRKRAEEEYRTILRTTMDGFWIVDMQGHFLDVNDAYCCMVGYSRDELLTMRIPDVEAVEGPKETARRIQKIMEVGEDRFETRDRCKDGKIIDMEVSVNYMEVGSGRMFVFLRDITKRKKAEEVLMESEGRFRSLYEQAPLGYQSLDVEGCFIGVNQAWLDLFRYSRDQVIGRWFGDFLAPQEVDMFKQRFQRFKASGKVSVDLEMVQCTGSTILVHIDGGIGHDEHGQFKQTHCILYDITARKRAEEQLRNSQGQLRALSAHLQNIREEERTLMAREVHDELGQELTGLKMDLSWLTRRLSKNQKSLISKTESMLKLVDSTIRTVRRISSELRPGVLDDLGLIAAIEWQTQDFENRTGITCDFSSSLEEIGLDRDRSTAVFRISEETLTNVSRHAKATRVKISLEESADTLILQIEDNGKGIEESEVSHPKSLGLLGMRERVLVFGGEVEISGIPGKGTSVVLKIPLER